MVFPAYRMLDGNAKEVDSSSIPATIITGSGADPKPRLKVDPGQTSFFEGREFRTFYELDMANAEVRVFKIVVPVNTILTFSHLGLDAGAIRQVISVGGTEGGSFSTALPVIAKNRMTGTPVYASQNTLVTGGTVTVGTTIDVVRLTAGNGQPPSVGVTQEDARGILPGTYYYSLTATGATTGTLKLNWEERP